MPLNGSGPISLAGSTAGQSIALELGLSATGTISLNDAAVRTLAGVASGAIVMPTDFYGKSNRVTASATISSDTANYTVNTAKATGYVAGGTDFTLTINSGVFVSSGSTGSYAMTVDTSWAAGDTVTIVNNGTIVGRGGDGGNGGSGTYV
jgi:predicted ATP-grasp superfamily ATP-dependent carboligase